MAGDHAEYFESYEDFEVHRVMLSDHQRIKVYKDAIFSLKEFIKDKIIMDVGAGTGILSIFVAWAGAKKVYAVEASGVAKIAQKVIEKNNLSDVIQVIHSRVEDVELPFGEKVDTIVSEWMGFYLLHEGMLDSIIAARDKHLKPDGRILPESAILYCSPCSIPSHFDFWENIFGINLSVVGRASRKTKHKRPEIMEIKKEDLLSNPHIIFEINLKSVTCAELDTVSSKCIAVASRDGKYQGVCIWFSCLFPAVHSEDTPIMLSTSPEYPPTHWKQTVIILPEEVCVEQGQPLAWELKLNRSEENSRQYNINFTMLDPEEEEHPKPCYCYMTKCIILRVLLETEKEPEDCILECED